jgi:hypothetical protein
MLNGRVITFAIKSLPACFLFFLLTWFIANDIDLGGTLAGRQDSPGAGSALTDRA